MDVCMDVGIISWDFFQGPAPPMPPFPGNKGTIQGQKLSLVENPLKRSFSAAKWDHTNYRYRFPLTGFFDPSFPCIFGHCYRGPITPLITKL